jgi:hypothetical protein
MCWADKTVDSRWLVSQFCRPKSLAQSAFGRVLIEKLSCNLKREGPDPTARPLRDQVLLRPEGWAVILAALTLVCVGSHVTGVAVRRVCECRCRT